MQPRLDRESAESFNFLPSASQLVGRPWGLRCLVFDSMHLKVSGWEVNYNLEKVLCIESYYEPGCVGDDSIAAVEKENSTLNIFGKYLEL